MMAPTMSAPTMAMPWYTFWSTRLSTGSRYTMPMATPIPPANTPMKFQNADHTTATQGRRALV